MVSYSDFYQLLDLDWLNFQNSTFRLSSTNKNRMEIGSGTLKMALDEKLEKRIEFWTKIWFDLLVI